MKKIKLNKKVAFAGGIVAGVGLTIGGIVLGKKIMGDPVATSFSIKPLTGLGEVGIYAYDKNRFGKEYYVTAASFDPDGAVDLANAIMDAAATVANEL